MIQLNFSHILAAYLFLLLFGIGFNALVSFAQRQNYLEGYTAFAVAFGVMVTLCTIALFDWRMAAFTLGAFVASGSPMIIGSVVRHVRARKQEQDHERQTATLAE